MIDLVLHDVAAHLAIATEVETSIARLEQQIRWAHLKTDSLPSADLWPFLSGAGEPSVSRLLIVRSTRDAREVVGRFAEVVGAAYPAASAHAYDALVGESDWPGPALLWADIDGGRATIRPTPPRGIRVGD